VTGVAMLLIRSRVRCLRLSVVTMLIRGSRSPVPGVIFGSGQAPTAGNLTAVGEHERGRALGEDTLSRRRILGDDHPNTLDSPATLFTSCGLGKRSTQRITHTSTGRPLALRNRPSDDDIRLTYTLTATRKTPPETGPSHDGTSSHTCLAWLAWSISPADSTGALVRPPCEWKR
jgi:hypothetical protein